MEEQGKEKKEKTTSSPDKKGTTAAAQPWVITPDSAREIISESKSMSEVLVRLETTLALAADKNDSLLEAIEATEARASQENQTSEVRNRINVLSNANGLYS